MKLLAFEESWLLSIFEAILPSAAHPRVSLGASDVPMRAFVRELMTSAPAQTALGVRAATWVVTFAPLLILKRFRLFGSLSPALRASVLSRMAQADFYPIRELPMLLKMMACMGYAALPEVRDQIGIAATDRTLPTWAESERGAA